MTGDFNLTVILQDLPKRKWFWQLVAGAIFVLVMVILFKSDHWKTALFITFLLMLAIVFFKTLRILAHPYTSSNQKAGWAIGFLALFLLTFLFGLLMRSEWRSQSPPPILPTSPATEQTLPVSINQSTANQTSP